MRRLATWVFAATVAPFAQGLAQAPVGVSQLDELFRNGQRVRIVIDAPVVQTRIVGYVTRHALDTLVVDTSETWRSRVWFNPRPPVVDEFRSVSLDISHVD